MPIDLGTNTALDTIVKAVKHRQCILFLGAGVHCPAPEESLFAYGDRERPPSGYALSQALARTCELSKYHPKEHRDNLQRVSLFFELSLSRKRLIDEVEDKVQRNKTPSPMLRALAKLDFPIVITTNYDHLLETALHEAGKDPRVAVYTPDLEPTTDYRDPTPESPIVFKIHGDIAQRKTVVITEEDYIKFILRMNSKDPYDPVPLALKYHLTAWTTVFVGYSLFDYNLRLLFRTLRDRVDPSMIPSTYSVDHQPDPVIAEIWEDQQVRFIVEDVWKFVPRLYERVTGEELLP